MKTAFCAIVLASCPIHIHAGIITATVEVVNSTPGEFVPLESDASVLGYTSRYTWNEIPSLLTEQPLHVWRVNGTGSGSDPSPEYGIISFNVVESGNVWMAVTTRFGGGGNSSGNWIPELSTRAELEANGWFEVATGLNDFDNSLNTISLEYIVFERQSIAGESFTYRTEKYPAALADHAIQHGLRPRTVINLPIGCGRVLPRLLREIAVGFVLCNPLKTPGGSSTPILITLPSPSVRGLEKRGLRRVPLATCCQCFLFGVGR